MEEKNGVIAFAFGAPWNLCCNKQIAEIASQKALELKAPIFTQLDIHIELGIIKVFYIGKEYGDQLPTLRIARAAVKWAKEQGIGKLWVAAAEPHLWRCLRDLEQAISEAREKIGVEPAIQEYEYQEDSWFSLESRLWHTRSRKEWNQREGTLKHLPFFLYKMIAK
ncbi:MAG: hypothetical protein WC697_02190 [Patescibacteria group bacterium]|jgi:hypothetical protein